METEFERAKAAIEAMRIGAADTEEEIHMQAARMFENAGLAAEHEVRLAPRCRIEFYGWRNRRRNQEKTPAESGINRPACPLCGMSAGGKAARACAEGR